MMVLHVLRSVNLLKYQKVDDIIPYYCEALIHLSIKKNSDFLLKININKNVESLNISNNDAASSSVFQFGKDSKSENLKIACVLNAKKETSYLFAHPLVEINKIKNNKK